jgi:hypothetical protein
VKAESGKRQRRKAERKVHEGHEGREPEANAQSIQIREAKRRKPRIVMARCAALLRGGGGDGECGVNGEYNTEKRPVPDTLCTQESTHIVNGGNAPVAGLIHSGSSCGQMR